MWQRPVPLPEILDQVAQRVVGTVYLPEERQQPGQLSLVGRGRDVIQVLESLNAKGLSLIVVTHDPEVGSRAARTIKMKDGRIVSDSANER